MLVDGGGATVAGWVVAYFGTLTDLLDATMRGTAVVWFVLIGVGVAFLAHLQRLIFGRGGMPNVVAFGSDWHERSAAEIARQATVQADIQAAVDADAAAARAADAAWKRGVA